MRSATTLVSAAGSAIGAVARLGLLAIVSAVTASACGGGARSDAAAGLDDAWRVVMNVMTDHRVFGVDPWQTTYAARLGGFFRSQGQYDAEYTLAGMSLDSNHSAGLVAMNATLGFALSGAAAKPFVQELWDLPVPSGQFRYYDGMLYLLGLLHTSGKFQFFGP